MKQEINEVELNGVKYVRKDSVVDSGKAVELEGMKYVCIRTYSAGCHCGYLESRDGMTVVLRNSRRLWYWDGAASLSQLAMEGVSRPSKCKFPCEVDRIELTAIEIIDMTEKARLSVKGVLVWEQ